MSGIRQIGNVKQYGSYDRIEETRKYWRAWTDKINYSGLYYYYVLRSALTLKGLFYEPTGMMVAAPTTSLPETLGGERNWDYTEKDFELIKKIDRYDLIYLEQPLYHDDIIYHSRLAKEMGGYIIR